MIKKLILLGVCIMVLVAISYAGDAVDADRPGSGYLSLESGLMNWQDVGLDLPDTSIVNDTVFTNWIHDYNSRVSPYKFSVSISTDSIGANTYAGKLYMVWANDTTDIFLVDSAISGTVNSFDTTYQEIPNGAAFYRWYFLATDSCLIEDFRIHVSGYK